MNLPSIFLLFLSNNVLWTVAFRQPSPSQYSTFAYTEFGSRCHTLAHRTSSLNPTRHRKQLQLSSASTALDTIPSINPALLAVAALALGILANVWIQSMLSGERGLGNFLSDGSGFGNSKFLPFNTKMDDDRAVGSGDPLPWLRLPQLDFVDVAGQPKGSDPVVARLEELRANLNERLEQGDLVGAETVRDEMERLMLNNGISFTEGE